jgi:hypothetical protein
MPGTGAGFPIRRNTAAMPAALCCFSLRRFWWFVLNKAFDQHAAALAVGKEPSARFAA